LYYLLIIIQIRILQEKAQSHYEQHKMELDQLEAKLRLEIEKLKNKHHEEVQALVRDHQMKLTELNLK
jgi:hypothetical protein